MVKFAATTPSSYGLPRTQRPLSATAPAAYADDDAAYDDDAAEERELREGIGLLFGLEKELHHLQTERIREERDELEQERDAWKKRCEDQSAAARAGPAAARRGAAARGPEAPRAPPRTRRLFASLCETDGAGYADEAPGADEVLDLEDAGVGDATLGLVVARVQRAPSAGEFAERDREPAGDGRKCRLSHALLRNNGLSDGAAPALRTLAQAQRLRVLDVSGNDLGGAALGALVQSLRNRGSCSGLRLQRLCLEGNEPLAGAFAAGETLGAAPETTGGTDASRETSRARSRRRRFG